MVQTKRTSTGKWVSLAIAAVAMFGTAVIPSPEGLSQSGFQVLGILVGASILFLSWGTGWPSMATILAFLTVPELTANQVTQATFGNSTLVFLLFTFMLAGCLTKSGVARRIAIWFMTNKLARKNPWWTIAMIFIANYVISLFLSCAPTFMIMFPIVEEMLQSVGINKEDKAPLATALILGVLITGLMSNASNPIAHAMTLQGFAFYQAYTGEAMDFFAYVVMCTPVTVIVCALYFAVMRFLWRPNVEALANVNYDSLTAGMGPMTKKQKWSAIFYLLCVLFWLLPGLTQYVWPAANKLVFSKIQQCIPPLLALFLMNFINVDNEPIFAWNDAVAAVPWPVFLFIACIMGLGSFMGNKDLGITAWLATVFTPVFQGLSANVFVFCMLAIMAVMCIFCTAAVPLALTFAIGMPICSTVYAGQVNPMVLAAMATLMAGCSWSTAPCSPISAISYGSGWVVPKNMIKYGVITIAIVLISCLLIGVPIGNML